MIYLRQKYTESPRLQNFQLHFRSFSTFYCTFAAKTQMEIQPIAYFHSPMKSKFGIPRQSGLVSELTGCIVFEPAYRRMEAIHGLEDFDYLWLIWEFSANGQQTSLTVRPPRLGGNKRMGVFATRSPFRPNGLGLSCVRIDSIVDDQKQGPLIYVKGADLMDGTPIYDIKPYVAYADSHPEARSGFVDKTAWQELEVFMPEDLCESFSDEELASLRKVLALDPRPRYQEDPERVYGMPFADYDVRFKVSGQVLTVVDCVPSAMDYESLWHRLTVLYEAGEAKAIVRLVLEERFGFSLADILSGKLVSLSDADKKSLDAMIHRLEGGEPVQYVLGVADFCGRQFHVAPGVLIPRPETAELCQWITQCSTSLSPCAVLDIGTGSGCIAVTLAAELSGAEVVGWDISEVALEMARENARRIGVHVTFEQQDALHLQSDARRWDIIVSNPPYIKPEERDGMEKNVLDHEPGIALFAPQEEPAIFYYKIADYAQQALNPHGYLYFELNPLTAEAVADYLRQSGFQDIEIRKDQFGKNRFLKAKKI